MAASSKFELSSSSSDGPAHLNGYRGPHGGASLERPGSFREGLETRISSSIPSTSRTGSVSLQGDTSSVLQSVASELKAGVLDQKLPRSGEARRFAMMIFGSSAEDSLPTTISTRTLPSSSVEEIKRMRNHLQESSVKARDRAKAFGDAVLKMDKCGNIVSRKRSRADNSSSERPNATLSGGNTSKLGPQSSLTSSGLEIGPQKSEEKTKSSVPNRRIRTSLVDVRIDGRANGAARASGPMDRDRDVFKLVSGSTTPSEEKARVLPAAVDGWEKKMKKKRSVLKSEASGSVVSARPQDGDRELKRGIQQKLMADARPRMNNTHGFRSGPTGIAGVGKLDSASQSNGIAMRPFPRNDQDSSSLPNDRKDRLVGLDKEGVALKASSKPNSREDNFAASPTSIMKMNSSARGPRSNSGSLAKGASPNINRGLGNSDDWEHPQSVNKLNGGVGAANRKRSASIRSSSPPVTQWVGQRPQKITRVARRSNLPPVVSSRDEYQASDIHDSAGVNEDGLGFTRRLSTNASQQSKPKGEHALSAGLSESDESGIADNKSKDKSKKCNEIEDKAASSVQKIGTVVLPSRKSKVSAEEDLEDNIQRPGKIGRAVTPSRSGMPMTIEKLDSAATAKQMRSTRINYEKIESKPGRPPTKKWSERKGHTRPRHSYAGESDDDHEELLAAAKASLNAWQVSGGSFWKQCEDFFAFLSAVDRNFLNQEIRLTEDAASSACGVGDVQSPKVDLEYNSLPPTPTLINRDDYGGSQNGFISLNEHERDTELAIQMKHVEPFLEELVQRSETQNGVSICQALLSAIIEEEEIANFNYMSNNEEDDLYDNAYGVHFEVDSELKSKSLSFQSLGTFQAVESTALDDSKTNASWRFHDELVHEDLENHCALDELLPNLTTSSSSMCTEFQYSQMSINDRILLELSEIGLYPEPVPYLAQSEDEDISEGINKLEEKLHEQVKNKKKQLVQLEKAITEAPLPQQRDFERMALDKLVLMANEKYQACYGPNAKNVSRTNKHATEAFVRRTLIRYHRFEETGSSCFSEPEFRDMFFSAFSHNGDVGRTDISANAVAAHQFVPSRRSEISLRDQNQSVASRSAQRVDIHDKYSDAFRSVNHLTEQNYGRENHWSNKLKKKELLLDDVVGSAAGTSLRASSGIGSSFASGTKGKRSERDREGKGQNRDVVSRNGTAKIGRPTLSNTKGERKNKPKPKQKMTQLSASVNGFLGKATETPNKRSPSAPKSREVVGRNTKKDEVSLPSGYVGVQDDAEAMDFSNLQLPEIDVGDFGGQGQDIGSWLNIEEDALQDDDFMGLEIPMDDLSEVNMMI